MSMVLSKDHTILPLIGVLTHLVVFSQKVLQVPGSQTPKLPEQPLKFVFYPILFIDSIQGACRALLCTLCCVLSDSSTILEHLLLGDEVGGTAKDGVAHSRLHKHTRDVLARIPALLGSLQFFKKKSIPRCFDFDFHFFMVRRHFFKQLMGQH